MKLTKSNNIINLVNNYIIDSPTANNINYWWNIGSLLGLNLIIMIISGILLSMHYTCHISLAFISIEHILRDVNNGWLLKYLHANGASMFFALVYLHIGRGLYYGSYRKPRIELWLIGIFIYLIMMATAFLGYVLPWGQMSLWGATVITNLLTVIPWIGNNLTELIWGSWSVDNPTLNRFYSLHYLCPFIILILVILHLISLHTVSSNNPLGIFNKTDRLRFHPYFISKDLITFYVLFGILSIYIFYHPNLLGEVDNYIPANPMITPNHIVPEWYFLFAYAILRSIPNKILGVFIMLLAIFIYIPLAIFSNNNIRSYIYIPIFKFTYWIFFFNFLMLTWLGAQSITYPYTLLSISGTITYFIYILILLFPS